MAMHITSPVLPISRPILIMALLIFGILWGGTVPFTKMAVATGHHPLGLIFWQMVLAILLLGPIAIVRKSALKFDRQHLKFFTIIAIVGTVLPNSFSYLASFHLPGGVMALAIATVPVFSLLIALLIRVEKLNLKRTLGVLCGAVAVALLVLPESSLPDPSKVFFVFIALIAPLAYGVEGNYLAQANPPETGPVATLLGASIIGLLISFPLALFSGGFVDPFNEFGKAEWALVASIGLHIIAYVGYIWLVSKAGAVFSAQIAYIVTPAGVVLSSLILGETHSHWLWASLALMLVALALVIVMFLLFGSTDKLPSQPVHFVVLGWLGIVASGLGYFLWNKGATRVDAGTLAIMNNALVPAGLLVNLLIWNRDADLPRLALGGAVIVLALLINQFWARQREQRAREAQSVR